MENREMKYALTIVLGILLAGASSAAQQNTIETTITKIYTYTQIGGGDVLVLVANPATNCADGFWLSPLDDGFKSTLSSLLAAHRAGSKVQIYGLDTQLWPGSSGAFCRLTLAIAQG
jgi:hypothetical protein